MMKSFVPLILAAGLATGPVALAFAQSNRVPLPQASPPTASSKPVAGKKAPFELAKDLDGLFKQLGRTSDSKLADRISTRIWEIWHTSDSKSVDLLTKWARTASGKRSFNVALDLLDQVVALRPNYAEGFNQRATLHFMMENYGKSIADIERTLALEPRHYGALAGLATILERIGEKDRALETWHRVLSVYPAMTNAQDSVVRLEEELAGNRI
ncbi:MAG: hypothetical protein GKR97_00390 [Rhizobiaceae bacterium]|nr:hypothetical protein [Rhizobiaceae bacterium]